MTDSSLSGNDTFELLSPILVGETGLRELEKVCWVLDLCDVKVNESCGLHVYIDATGFNMETWRNLALSYKHLEPVIDRFMPASRRRVVMLPPGLLYLMALLYRFTRIFFR